MQQYARFSPGLSLYSATERPEAAAADVSLTVEHIIVIVGPRPSEYRQPCPRTCARPATSWPRADYGTKAKEQRLYAFAANFSTLLAGEGFAAATFGT